MKAATLVLTGELLLTAAAAARAQEPAADPALARMKSVLLQKAPLKLTPVEPEATFKIEIHAIHPMHEVFEKPLWQLDPIGWQPPGVGLDLMMVVRYVEKVKREHDERSARDEVQRSIDDYCAQQPNANTIQICSTSRAIR
jgi:hypothetical protein